MDKNILMVGLVGILLVVSVFQAFQLSTLTGKISALKTVSAGTGAVSASVPANLQTASGGESYEEMMARMHPDQVQQQPAQNLPSNLQNLPSQVGGC